VKFTLKPTMLPWLTLGLGGIGLAVRSWLYSSALDSTGLFVPSHPANILTWVVTFAAMVVLILCLRFSMPGGEYLKLFPKSIVATSGCFIGAVGIAASGILELMALPKADYTAIATLVAGILGSASLVYLGLCRFWDMRPSVLFRSLVCVYFMLHLISQYRSWSAETQLQEFFFQLRASVLLMLASYHRATLEDGKRPLRRYLIFHQLALFFCCMAMVGQNRLFYLTMGAWTLLDSCAIVSVTKLWEARK